MATVIVGIVLFGSLGAILYSLIKKGKSGGSGCHSSCAGCPYVCDKKEQ